MATYAVPKMMPDKRKLMPYGSDSRWNVSYHVDEVRRHVVRDRRKRVPMRLTARGRMVVFLISVLLTAVVAAAFGSASAQSAPESVPVTTYTVQPGDTLWSYAERITPDGGDVRDTVDELIVMNDLDGGVLQAGQRLIVPDEI